MLNICQLLADDATSVLGYVLISHQSERMLRAQYLWLHPTLGRHLNIFEITLITATRRYKKNNKNRYVLKIRPKSKHIMWTTSRNISTMTYHDISERRHSLNISGLPASHLRPPYHSLLPIQGWWATSQAGIFPSLTTSLRLGNFPVLNTSGSLYRWVVGSGLLARRVVFLAM